MKVAVGVVVELLDAVPLALGRHGFEHVGDPLLVIAVEGQEVVSVIAVLVNPTELPLRAFSVYLTSMSPLEIVVNCESESESESERERGETIECLNVTVRSHQTRRGDRIPFKVNV